MCVICQGKSIHLYVLSLSVFGQGELHALYTKSARGWYLHHALTPRTSTSISFTLFIIVFHPFLVRQNSAYLLGSTNKLMETINQEVTHTLRCWTEKRHDMMP